MEILFLTKYSRLGSSSRYRALQYFPYLEADGWTVSWQHFLSDRYVRQFYLGRGRSTIEGARAILRRVYYLLRTRLNHFDVIHLQAEALPRIPFFLESMLLRNRDRLVLDYDDASFEPYQKNLFMRQKIARLANCSAHVIVANDYLRSYLSRYTSKLTIVPTVIDISRYQVKESHRWEPGHRVVIGWIGSPATTHYLISFSKVLQILSAQHRILLRCVGAQPDFKVPGVHVEHLPWTEGTEAKILRTFDIGVMPLVDEPFAKGKSGLKLIQYMGAAVPAIGAAMSANSQIIQDGVNGFLAASDEEYVRKIGALIANHELRMRLGMAGRRTAEEKYSLQAAAPAFCRLLREIGGTASGACASPLPSMPCARNQDF
jgi:glycosyltransferase involved in cell wall biosynthesis